MKTTSAVVIALLALTALSGCGGSSQGPSASAQPAGTTGSPSPSFEIKDITSSLTAQMDNPLPGDTTGIGEMVKGGAEQAAAITSALAVLDPVSGKQWVLVESRLLPTTLFVDNNGTLVPVCEVSQGECETFLGDGSAVYSRTDAVAALLARAA